MGARARTATARRAALRDQSRRLGAMDAEISGSPAYAALVAATHDDRVRALTAADLPGQAARLAGAGWRQRAEGDDGAGIWDHRRAGGLRILHSVTREADGQVWGHVSVSHRSGALPGWYELRDAQWLLYPDRAGLIVVAPRAEHVDLSEVAHAWTCLTASPVPDFRHFGQV